jgi:glutaminyl-tRNA synthetase
MLPNTDKTTNSNFIKSHIKEDLENGKLPNNKVIVRFPPEPNGYLHLGHAKSIILNSSLAEEFNGEINLRFDDTNPEKENMDYVNSIKEDAEWLVGKFTRTLWASDYFDTIYKCAEHLINNNLAYVDDNDMETIRALRGSFNNAGVDSPYRNRNIDENLTLLNNMKNGLYANGEKVLRAKIDMNHSNINMRDPILYRIKHAEHHNTGNTWCIYPMYDFAHPISDAIEGITHSICTMEFEDHRPLYDWTIENCYAVLGAKPVQIEFARLEMEGVILSKRKLNDLVVEKKVAGWDSPVMPTISGLRNRGFTPAIIKEFIIRCGFSKANSTIEKFVLEDCARDILNPISPRTMTILDPVLLEITNLNEDITINMPNHPKNVELGSRELTLTKNIWVERDDIRANAEPDFWRIYPGNWIRLKHGYNILIKEVITENDLIIKVIAEIDMDSKNPKMAKHKAKVALHWLSHLDSSDLTVNYYNNLCDEDGKFLENSVVSKMSKAEKTILDMSPCHYEFERNGYFYVKNNIAHCLAPLKSNK